MGIARRGRLIVGLMVCCFLGTAVLGASVVPGAETPQYLSSFGPDGTEASNFAGVGSVAVDQQTGAGYVLDVPEGTLYKFGPSGEALAFGGSAAYISGNKITGLSLFQGPTESQVAVDSETHLIYVTSANSVRAFHDDGEPAEFTAGPGAGTSELSDFGELIGVAVDSSGNIYASDYQANSVKIYTRSGEPLTEIVGQSVGERPANLAVGPDGAVYVATYLGPVRKFIPSEYPVEATTEYEEAEAPVNEHRAFAVAVDPLTGYVYISESYPEGSEATRVVVYDEAGAFVAMFGAEGEEGELKQFPLGLAVNGMNAKAYVGSDAGGGDPYSKVEIFEALSFPVLPPTVEASARDVTADSAVLQATVNPNTLPTTYYFEYGTTDCSLESASCSVVPLGGAAVGSGHKNVTVEQPLYGLSPNTTYHYRVVAENSLGSTQSGDLTFTTQGSSLEFGLADRRVWEMVSPPNKAGGTLRVSSAGALRAAADGNGLAYQSMGSIVPDPDGNRAIEPASVLGTRLAGGWKSEDITPPHTKATNVANGTEYNTFSPDLGAALLEPRDATPLSPEASERAPYLRLNTEPPGYIPLVTGKEGYANVAPGAVFGGDELHGMVSEVTISGANSDLSTVVLASGVPLLTGTEPPGALYEWTAGSLHPVSRLPADEGAETVAGMLGTGLGTVAHAVSADGSRVFWSTGNYGTTGVATTGLYLRDTVEEETVRLDVVQPGASGSGAALPAFQGASADGTIVYFTDSQQLTADASPTGRDLYRCEIPPGTSSAGCSSITNVSAPREGAGESAEVQGLVPAISEEGDRLYFVANGVLDSQANQVGDLASAGEPNLYLWEEGEARFVATLSSDDDRDWGKVNGNTPGYTRNLSAAGSPNGRYFAFMSERRLTGYDNRDAASGNVTEQVFAFDATQGSLTCISCKASGARPEGQQSPPPAADLHGIWGDRWVAATLPEATLSMGPQATPYPAYRPRAVLDNGRVFFNAVGDLVPADSNRNWDVYQHEPASTGDCSSSPQGAGLAKTEIGCVSLISSGFAGQPASLLDASLSGDDVFFLTSAPLAVTDTDDVNDVYDARVDGTVAVLPPASDCAGDACRSPSTPPDSTIPNSAAFAGPGNLHVKPKRRCSKRKRQIRRGGKKRCVSRHHPKHNHKHRTGTSERGEG